MNIRTRTLQPCLGAQSNPLCNHSLVGHMMKNGSSGKQWIIKELKCIKIMSSTTSFMLKAVVYNSFYCGILVVLKFIQSSLASSMGSACMWHGTVQVSVNQANTPEHTFLKALICLWWKMSLTSCGNVTWLWICRGKLNYFYIYLRTVTLSWSKHI